MRLRAAAIAFLLAVCAAVLAGCASSDIKASGFSQVGSALDQYATRLRAKRPAAPQVTLTRALANETTLPLLQVHFDMFDATAVLLPFGRNGAVETWRSVDGKTISLRQGIAVATRGFGGDLMAADPPDAARIAQGTGGYARAYVYLDGEDKALRETYACTLADLGAQTIVVVERSHATRHIRETCTGPRGTFRNDYWFERGAYLRKSDQWLSDLLGKAQFARVND